MKIFVLVKQILDPRGITVRRDKERIFINQEDYIIDPGSKAAIEAALRLKEAQDKDASVTALSMGEPRADDALREALAMGCDAAYLLSDSRFKDADIPATVRVLAAAVLKLDGADLILAGRQAGDTGAGQVGPRLAEALDYAQVVDAYTIELADGALQATRRWADGYATVRTSLPAVVTIAPEAFVPRYAHGARIMNAYRQWDVLAWTAADLELDEKALAPSLEFRSESFPPPIEVGEQFSGDPATVAQDLVTTLRLHRVID
jgi:electron transfer flavoprotein beta subunit